MERSIKDEMFVRRALSIVESENGRWIANQGQFNGNGDLCPVAHAGLVTATQIFVIHDLLPESAVDEAVKIRTVEQARNFIDKYNDETKD